MEMKIFDQVEKILFKESEEIRQDLRDILEKLKLGISFGPPTVKPLTNIYSNLYEIRVKDKRGNLESFILSGRRMRYTFFTLLEKRSNSCLRKKKK